MTVSMGATCAARCDACGSVWLDGPCCAALSCDGLDDEARSLVTGGSHAVRRGPGSPFRDASERSAATQACPVCLRELTPHYVHDADVTVGACAHGVLVAPGDVAAFLSATDIRRTLDEMERQRVVGVAARNMGGPRPGGILLRLGGAALLASLALPSVRTRILFDESDVIGFFGAVFGPFVAFAHPILAVPVIANYLALAMLVLSRRLGPLAAAGFASIFATGAMCSACFGLAGEEKVLVGYWVWFVALVLLALGSALRSSQAHPLAVRI